MISKFAQQQMFFERCCVMDYLVKTRPCKSLIQPVLSGSLIAVLSVSAAVGIGAHQAVISGTLLSVTEQSQLRSVMRQVQGRILQSLLFKTYDEHLHVVVCH